jgi:site-specific DNA-adenine methylase
VTFTTERLPLAVYLHATADLDFSHCKKIADDKVSFVFLDPNQQGNELELAFERGGQVSATALFASQNVER